MPPQGLPPELAGLDERYRRLADEVGRLKKLRSGYTNAIAEFNAEKSDLVYGGLSEQPGCLGGLFGAKPEKKPPTARPASKKPPTPSKPPEPGRETASAGSCVAALEKVLAATGDDTSLPPERIQQLRAGYEGAIAELKDEKEKLIS